MLKVAIQMLRLNQGAIWLHFPLLLETGGVKTDGRMRERVDDDEVGSNMELGGHRKGKFDGCLCSLC